ncbi:hypothetical protein DFA_02592 [Cavenderia fasciculata]|uniref:Uncharacterized protein n=1 Tax=Cavenderia fasciculata TaxID=261658 RepID=F4PZT9_CACFS|nr:uncharacterized protein DFA_02592 [Cavenderia fasciculata]EGG18853.1 hypothetical protein DFA_02592 [Cavenderia fasciculata]|eukprot:XP_004357315.1 hypothetical protein DFA_02592 [Cavenderia fasciculata]
MTDNFINEDFLCSYVSSKPTVESLSVITDNEPDQFYDMLTEYNGTSYLMDSFTFDVDSIIEDNLSHLSFNGPSNQTEVQVPMSPHSYSFRDLLPKTCKNCPFYIPNNVPFPYCSVSCLRTDMSKNNNK